ncbi:MAG: hypothetical protein HY747_06985 [Elusimicrobia bacterium]|nr:hypothetical protein [Elusimicrobiota bacterium]
MGESFAALSDEPFGISYNPAGMSFMPDPAISFLHQEYIQDFKAQFIGLVLPFGKLFRLGAAPSFISMKEEPIYDSLGRPTGRNFGYEGRSLPVAASLLIGGLSIGGAVKSYSEEIGGFSQKANTWDAGLIYRYKKFRLGAAALNLSGMIGGYELPRTLKTGAAYTSDRLTLSAGFDKQMIKEESFVSLGSEFGLTKNIFIRAGYRSQKFGGFSGGVGLKFLKAFSLDCAYASYGDLGGAYRAGMTIQFLPQKKKPLEAQKSEEPVQGFGEVSAPAAPAAGEGKIPVPKGKKFQVAALDFTARGLSEIETGALSDFFRSALVNTNAFIVVDRVNMEKILIEQKFQQTGCTTEECAVQIGKILNVQKMVTGAASFLQGVYYLDAKFIDVETSQVQAVREAQVRSVHEFKKASEAMARGFVGLLVEVEETPKQEEKPKTP